MDGNGGGHHHPGTPPGPMCSAQHSHRTYVNVRNQNGSHVLANNGQHNRMMEVCRAGSC